MRYIVFICVILTLCIFWGDAFSDLEEGKQQQLEQIRDEIEKEQKAIEDLKVREKGIINQLDKLDRQLDNTQGQLKKCKKQIYSLEDKILESEKRIATLQKDLEAQQDQLASRLVAMYKFNEIGYLGTILSASTLPELLNRQRFFRLIVDQDKEMIQGFQNSMDDLYRERAAYKEDKEKRQTMVIKLASIKQKKAKERRAKENLRISVMDERGSHEIYAKELEVTARNLETLLEKLRKEEKRRRRGKRGKEFTGFAMLKGFLPFPVEGKIDKHYGKYVDPNFKTKIQHKGIDIKAPFGAPISAVYSGRVVFAGWFKGYGKMIIIDHGEGYFSLVAHASELLYSVGEEVQIGDIIAHVGDTGSLKGPYLYFEIRHNGKSLDPERWLAKK